MNTRNKLLLLISFSLVIIFTFFMCTRKQPEEQTPEKKLTNATDTVIRARIIAVVGQAELLRKGRSEWLQTRPGTQVSSGDIIRTARESRIVINMLGYGSITIAEQSLISISVRLLLNSMEYAACNIKHGNILVNMHKLVTSRRRFVVRTPTAVAAIRGTSFMTYVEQNTGESIVQVLRGEVGVKKRSFKKIKRNKIITDHSLTQKVLRPTENLSAANIASVMNDLDQDWELELEIKAQKKIAAIKKKIEKKAESQNLSYEEIETKIKKEQEKIERKLQAMTGGLTKETIVERGEGVSVVDEEVTAPEELTSDEIVYMSQEFSEELVEEAFNPPTSSDDTQEESDFPSNTPPQFVSEPPQSAQCNEVLEYRASVEDDNVAGMLYNLQQAPKGMNIGSISGTVIWTPTDTGEYQVVVEARDIDGLKNTQSFTIKVNCPVEEPVQPLPKEQPIKQPPVEQKPAIDSSLQKETKKPDVIKSHTIKKPTQLADTSKPSVTSKQTTDTEKNTPPTAKAGSDVVSYPNRTVRLKGVGQDIDDNIVAYEWDFNCDGKFDWKSETTGKTSYKFTKYSYAVFRVTDSEGEIAEDTVLIVICPEGMRTIEDRRFCIDTYEWPNKKGAIPLSKVTYNDAEKKCKSVGKRLCTRKEMVTACSGEDKQYRYPYGHRFLYLNCNTLGNKRIDNKITKSGNFELCKSKYGVFDMSGNLAELTSSGSGKNMYVVGGWWQDGKHRAKCTSYVSLEKSRKFFYVGFRCCK